MTSTIKPTEKKRGREKSLFIWTRCDVLLQYIINVPSNEKENAIKTIIAILKKDYRDCYPVFRKKLMNHLNFYLEEDIIDKEEYELIKKKFEE